MSGICEELAELLSTVQRPGDFYASGRVEILAPRLEVGGIGQVALPLLPIQAQQLIAIADRAILGAIALFPPRRAAEMIAAIVTGHAGSALAPCCALLRAAITGPFAAEPAHLAPAAKSLVAALAGDPEVAPVDEWVRRRKINASAGVVADLVRITEAIGTRLAVQMARHVLAWPGTYSLDRALVPAVKRLVEDGVRQSGAAMKILHAACLEHLEARAAHPLEAPKDWTRDNHIRCKCEHCSALGRFLESASAERWACKAAERVRGHVEREIKAARADLDVRTDRQGRPYSLICRKTHASYDRRVAQRRQDLAAIAALKGSTGGRKP